MRRIGLVAAIAAGCLPGLPASAQSVLRGPQIIHADHQDVSPPLRSLAPGQEVAGEIAREKPLRLFHPSGTPQNQPDPVLQSTVGTSSSITAGTSFAGVGLGDYGFTPNAAPPDTNGSVGATQYVQWVNESFAVFNKATHALVYGPAAGNTLWSGFGGGCQTNNDGDPVVLWDKAAQRWIMTQFSVSTTPYLQCVAISQTSDATGAWYRYSFQMPNFNDYPKVGVWPDAYYMSFNMFNGNSFAGGRACALDRNSMLNGAPATAQCFQLSTAYGGLLPSDLDGSTAPPAGSPNYFLAFGNNVLQLWKFHVDWSNSANSTFAGPTNIPVASFSPACGGGTCIPQLGTTQQLDSLGDRLMFRLAYRNFGDHESLVVNHSVTAGSSVGVRWYEVRSPNGTPSVYQQGTFAPDSNYRWMGSIAMDQVGNIALGYSLSNSGLYPAIAYTGRVPTDPLGTLESEAIIKSGGGSQLRTLSRWGDYSAMSIDPTDDCTFWYTNEYLKSSGTFNWSTYIGTFKFPGCPATSTPDFSISASPASVSVSQGGSATSTISVTALNGFTGQVSLVVSGCPTGATCSLPTSVNPGSNSTLTIDTTSSTPVGTYTVTVTGTSGSLSHQTTVSVTVTAPSPGFSLGASPSSVTVKRSSSATTTITVAGSNGFNGAVSFSVSGLGRGTSASFNPSSVTGSGTTVLTFKANKNAQTGTFNVTITGTSGSLSASTKVTLTVQ
ncbi:MAG: hypothetical protein JST11_15895 [Acidobacteria bacterium]|nr:hypothetical protein [Acidobacteriota bacterium]